MVMTTPFHSRLSQLSATGLFVHWSGYLSAARYDISAKHEYFGVRNSAGLFDASPLFKYAITGPDATRFLGGVFARDVRTCKVGRAQYTIWCDDDGYVLEDGVLFRHGENDYLLTSAEPNLGYLCGLIGSLDVVIADVSDQYGTLVLQGPRSRAILESLAPEVTSLPFFAMTPAKVAGHAVTISRTGFTGDLGFELMVPVESALPVLDAVLAAGEPHGLRMLGNDALGMVRIEAGLPLIHVDFNSARLAYNAHEKFTPHDLGLGWLIKGIDDDSRPFIGRRAIRRELVEKTSRWATVGVMVDRQAYHDLFTKAGVVPLYDENPATWDTMLYDDSGAPAGYAPSLMYSPVLQRHIAMARVRPDLAALGTRVHVEQTVNHAYTSVPAVVTRLPFYNPERKTATP